MLIHACGEAQCIPAVLVMAMLPACHELHCCALNLAVYLLMPHATDVHALALLHARPALIPSVRPPPPEGVHMPLSHQGPRRVLVLLSAACQQQKTVLWHVQLYIMQACSVLLLAACSQLWCHPGGPPPTLFFSHPNFCTCPPPLPTPRQPSQSFTAPPQIIYIP